MIKMEWHKVQPTGGTTDGIERYYCEIDNHKFVLQRGIGFTPNETSKVPLWTVTCETLSLAFGILDINGDFEQIKSQALHAIQEQLTLRIDSYQNIINQIISN